MPTTTDLTKLVINEVDSEATYSAMVSGGLVNPDELYFIPGVVTRTAGILFGAVDGTSTSTVFTATVPGLEGVTEYYDGLTVVLKNGVKTSASGFTLNLNGLGAKPVYSSMSAASQETTIFNVAYTMMFIYDSTRVSGGAWVLYRGYNSNDNTIGYQLRTNDTAMTVSDTARYYKIYFTSADNTQWVPASVNSSSNATTARAVNQRPINPFGRIVYVSADTNYTSGSTLTATKIWNQYKVTLGYSFNRTGAALTLTTATPVYIKCAPQANGSAIIDADTPYVQALPSTEDGKIYIYLGVAVSATQVEIYQDHPVYYYKDSAIRLWSNQSAPTVTSTYSSTGTDPINGAAVNAALQTLDSSITAETGKAISAITITDGKISGSTKISVGESNQNAFSNIKIGNTTIAADAKMDTLELVAGTGISLTADTSNDKVTITSTVSGDVTDVQVDSTSVVSNKIANIKTSTSHPYDSDSNPLATIGDVPDAVSVKGNAETNYRTGQVNLTPANLGLGNVTNDKQLPIAGGTMTGALTLSGAPTNNLHAATKKYVDDSVSSITNAMLFKGTVGKASGGSGTVNAIPTSSVRIGDTYKIVDESKSIVAANSTTGTAVTAEIGDVIVATATTPKWTVIPSGDEPSGTVTSVATGDGLTGGAITTSGTLKANLRSFTKLTNASAAATETANRVYPVALDKDGYLSVNVPWTNVNSNYAASGHTHDITLASDSGTSTVTLTSGGKFKLTAGGKSVIFTMPTSSNNAGTVTKVSTGVGLTGGDITSSGTVKAKLKNETASTLSSTAMGTTANRQYAVGVDKDGYLSVNVPWEADTNTDTLVSQTETTTGNWRKVVVGYQNDSTEGTNVTGNTNVVYVNKAFEFQPSTGTVKTTQLKTTSTTDATSSTVAPMKTAGGLAVAKKIWVGSGLGASSNNNTSSQLIISSNDTGSGGNVALELWRGSNASWQISNESGNLHIRTNYTTAKQSTYSVDALQIAYNSGNATFLGSVSASSFSGSGASLTSLNATNVSSGTLAKERLATSGVTAGSYGPSANATPAYGATFNVPYITVDTYGRVTAASTKTVTIPASDNTDTKNTAGSTDTSSKIYLVGATSQAANPQTYSDNQVYATNGQLDANKVRVAEAVTLEYNSTTKSLDFIFA